jgi:hypothetical protein
MVRWEETDKKVRRRINKIAGIFIMPAIYNQK